MSLAFPPQTWQERVKNLEINVHSHAFDWPKHAAPAWGRIDAAQKGGPAASPALSSLPAFFSSQHREKKLHFGRFPGTPGSPPPPFPRPGSEPTSGPPFRERASECAIGGGTGAAVAWEMKEKKAAGHSPRLAI